MVDILLSVKKAGSSSSVWSDASNILIDVLINIVKRLSLKDITRMTSVSKSWHSVLTSPTFINAHLSYRINRSYKLRLFSRSCTFNSNATFFILDRRCSNDNSCISQCPVNGHKQTVVASGDGLFCLSNYLYSGNPDTEPITLWNPYTGKTRVVPVSADDVFRLTIDAQGCPMLIFGFGHDYVSATYKLVRVGYFNVTGYGSPGVGTYFQTRIYDLGLNTWRRVTDVVNMSLHACSIRWRGWCFNGVIHWSSSFHSDDKIYWTILTFNLGTEQFGEIKLPESAADSINQTVNVVIIPKGSREVLGVAHSTHDVLTVWMMEQYAVEKSWVKLFDLQLPCVLRCSVDVAVYDHGKSSFTLLKKLEFHLKATAWPVDCSVNLGCSPPHRKDSELMSTLIHQHIQNSGIICG